MNTLSTILTIIAIDDEPMVLQDTAAVLHGIPNLKLLGTFTAATEALAFLREHGRVDIVLCDIRMPGISGLEAASLLINHCRLFALLTGHPQYTAEAYRRSADAYLLKPLEPADAERLIEKLSRHHVNRPAPLRMAFDKLFVYDGGEKTYYPVALTAITKILSGGNYSYVYAPDLVAPVKLSLVKAMQVLEDTGLFIQVNPAAVIGKNHITRVSQHVVYLGSETYKVTEHYAAAVNAFLKDRNLGAGNAIS